MLPKSALFWLAFSLLASAWGCGGDDSGVDPDLPSSPVLWERRFGGPFEDTARGIDVVSSNEIYMVMDEGRGPIDRDLLVSRLDGGGAVLWETRWGQEFAERANAVESDGLLVYVVGSTQRALGIGSADAFVAAFDAQSGELRWETIWDGGDGQDELHGLALAPEGIFAAGWSAQDFGGHDVLLQRLEYDGDLVWSQLSGGALNDEALAAPVVEGGLVYVAGRAAVDDNGNGGDALLAAFDRSGGSLVWTVTSDANRSDAVLGLTTDGFALYMVGMRRPPNRSGRVVLWSFDLAGRQIWRTEWGGPGDEAARGIALDPRSPGLLVAGTRSGPGTQSYDLALLRVTLAGEVVDSLLYGAARSDVGNAIDADIGGVFVAGETTSLSAGGSDGWALRVDTGPWSPAPVDSAARGLCYPAPIVE